jgi:hypothetical protein
MPSANSALEINQFMSATIIPQFMLCFLSSEPKNIELALAYWETDKDGKFRHKARELSNAFGLRNDHALLCAVKQYATAYRHDLSCKSCANPLQQTSRSDNPNCICPDCKEAAKQSQIAQQKQAKTDLLKALDAYMHNVDKLTVDYRSVSDDVCLLIRALYKVVGDGMLLGRNFTARQCQSITAFDHSQTLEILRNHGIVQPVAASNTTKGFWLNERSLRFKSDEVDFRFTPHHSGSRDDAKSIVIQRHPTDEKTICRLWYRHAVEECIAYLIHETSTRGLCHLSAGGDEIIRATIENALRDFPISYLWYAIWHEVKTAAADSRKHYSNRAKATATIPGKLARFIENARNGTYQFRRWDRLNGQHESGLAQVFSEQLGLDLDTTGRKAEQHIQTAVNQGSKEALLTQYGQILRNMMKEATHKDLSAEVMLMFAEYQRMQFSLDESVGKIVESLSLDSLVIFQEKTD